MAFQKRILKFGAELQNEPGGPGDSSGNAPLLMAPDEGGRRSDFCLVSCLPFPAGDSYKHGCSPCVPSYVWCFQCPGFIVQHGFSTASAKGVAQWLLQLGSPKLPKFASSSAKPATVSLAKVLPRRVNPHRISFGINCPERGFLSAPLGLGW